MKIHDVTIDEARLTAFCRQHRITRLSLFGSILTDRFAPDSDVDFLVEFDPARRISLFDVGAMAMDLADMLGRPVDLRTAGDLSPYCREYVIFNARLLYAA